MPTSILPASAFAEKSGTFTNTDRRVQMARPVINPPGDARQDWWIIQEIAQRLGLDWNYDGPSDVFAEMAQVMPSFANITWERLEREGAVTYPVDAPDKPGNEIIFYSGFPTESGRAKIVPANVLPPDEVPDDDYPMVLSTGPGAGALAHRVHDASRRRAGRDRARGGRFHVAARSAGARSSTRAISSGSRRGEAPWR